MADTPVTLAAHPFDPLYQHLKGQLEFIRDCLCQALNDAEIPVCSCALEPGQQFIADVCGKTPDGRNGKAWVRMLRVFPDSNPQQGNTRCATLSAVELELGILRCDPSAMTANVTGKVVPPSEAQRNEAALLVARDAMLLQWVAACCITKKFLRGVGEWRPASGGGCTGGTITVQILLKPGVPA